MATNVHKPKEITSNGRLIFGVSSIFYGFQLTRIQGFIEDIAPPCKYVLQKKDNDQNLLFAEVSSFH